MPIDHFRTVELIGRQKWINRYKYLSCVCIWASFCLVSVAISFTVVWLIGRMFCPVLTISVRLSVLMSLMVWTLQLWSLVKLNMALIKGKSGTKQVATLLSRLSCQLLAELLVAHWFTMIAFGHQLSHDPQSLSTSLVDKYFLDWTSSFYSRWFVVRLNLLFFVLIFVKKYYNKSISLIKKAQHVHAALEANAIDKLELPYSLARSGQYIGATTIHSATDSEFESMSHKSEGFVPGCSKAQDKLSYIDNQLTRMCESETASKSAINHTYQEIMGQTYCD